MVTQWANARPIGISLESKQIFLTEDRLGEFTIDLIRKAKDEILITNPFVEGCNPINALKEAVGRRVKVKIVARRPDNKRDLPKLDFQEALKKEGILIHYNNQIHAKILTVDGKIAVVSSMNLSPTSAGGGSLEAGLVTFDKKIVDSVVKYVNTQLEKPEAVDPNARPTTYRKWNRY
jgi:phosphatidylserine/phosphatidylglycerophosphate/cardiolipin synthase-like enzyme